MLWPPSMRVILERKMGRSSCRKKSGAPHSSFFMYLKVEGVEVYTWRDSTSHTMKFVP